MTPRETWTDERLDEFKVSVNQRFDEVDKRFDAVDRRFDAVDKRIDRLEAQMHADIRELRQSIERMNIRMTTGFIGLAGLIVSAQIFF
ncbi:MAG TPA: hypothetical protein VFX35_02305 [Solirubrobacterales bacterium]|nr:hypothetical protein [Solirubrobacterales bacterium]